MASREELLQSIRPGAQLDKNFFLRIYGYEITWPGFADRALSRMEILGCSNARNYYSCIVAEYEYEYQKQMKETAAWYVAGLEKRWDQDRRKKGSEASRKQEIMQGLHQKSDRELLNLLQTLN